MSAYVTVRCDQCGFEYVTFTYLSIDLATSDALRNEGWQQITYNYGRAEYTEVRCPDCHVEPLPHIKQDQIIHREPAIDYA